MKPVDARTRQRMLLEHARWHEAVAAQLRRLSDYLEDAPDDARSTVDLDLVSRAPHAVPRHRVTEARRKAP